MFASKKLNKDHVEMLVSRIRGSRLDLARCLSSETFDHLKISRDTESGLLPGRCPCESELRFCMFTQRFPSEVHLSTSFMFLIKSVDMLKES